MNGMLAICGGLLSPGPTARTSSPSIECSATTVPPAGLLISYLDGAATSHVSKSPCLITLVCELANEEQRLSPD